MGAMKFKFSLEKVLRHRKSLEDLAQKDFQEALAVLNQEKQKLEEMQRAVDSARNFSFTRQKGGGTAGSSLSQVHDFLTGQDVRMDRQKKKIEHQEKMVEELREILRNKALDYKIMEGLKEKKKLKFKEQAKKTEQKKADEMNVMRFQREKPGA